MLTFDDKGWGWVAGQNNPKTCLCNTWMFPKEVCNGGVARSLMAADKPCPLLQNSLAADKPRPLLQNFLNFPLVTSVPFWFVLFLVCALFESCPFFCLCSFWFMSFLVCAVFDSCPFWFVLFLVRLFLVCAPFGCCHFWFVPFLVRALFGL